jgi:hypothetical protein
MRAEYSKCKNNVTRGTDQSVKMVFHGGTKNGKEENQKESNKEKSQEEKEIAARLTCAQHESRHFLAAFFFGTGS